MTSFCKLKTVWMEMLSGANLYQVNKSSTKKSTLVSTMTTKCGMVHIKINTVQLIQASMCIQGLFIKRYIKFSPLQFCSIIPFCQADIYF